MQPYLTYGYGFKASDLPEEERERLKDQTECYCWFTEYDAGTNKGGIFYIIENSPFKRESNEFAPWSKDLEALVDFKNKNEKLIDKKL